MVIEYTRQASEHKIDLIDFVAEVHSISAAVMVETGIDACLKQMALLPYSHPLVHTKSHGQVRKAVVQELTIILYRIEVGRILVIDILDARSDWK